MFHACQNFPLGSLISCLITTVILITFYCSIFKQCINRNIQRSANFSQHF
nr:MAG TPA: hypothetical protein [Caudoviricetes sp.]